MIEEDQEGLEEEFTDRQWNAPETNRMILVVLVSLQA